MSAAFAGGLGPEMKAKAQSWADETPNKKSLPKKKKKPSPTDAAMNGLKKAK